MWRNTEMPKTLRLTTDEQEKLRKKCIEINKLLIGKNKEPLRDSELAHEILEKSISYVKISASGEIYIDRD